MAKPVYYERNRQCGTTLYTDHMVLSPDVPVFRDDHGQFLAEPYLVSFITAPAVNAGVIRRSEAHNVERIAQTMAARIRYVLAVAVVHGYEHLVLGAWGCGVFRNDPDEIAGLFEEHLQGTGAFAKAFRTVVFAVLCRRRDESTIRPFRARFGQEI